MQREDAPNRPQSSRPGIGVRRAWMRRRGAHREKFFCCQNPRLRVRERALRADLRISRSIRHAAIARIANNEKHYNTSLFLHCCECRVDVASEFPASACERYLVASGVAHHALAARGVNTSLSGKLFFSMRWCIRDAVHFDSRVHAAIKPSHIGGHHG